MKHFYTPTPRQSVGNSCPPRAWRGQVQPVVTLSNNSNTWVHPCYRVTFVTTPSLREPLGSWQSLVLSRHEIPTVTLLLRNNAFPCRHCESRQARCNLLCCGMRFPRSLCSLGMTLFCVVIARKWLSNISNTWAPPVTLLLLLLLLLITLCTFIFFIYLCRLK